jgi:LmbE family N-acetylglucosaminyl deacetylase
MNGGGPQRVDDLKTYELVGMLDALVRDLEPAAVLTHSAAEFHRDHVNVHNACVSTQRLRQFDFFSFSPTMCRPVPVQFHPRLYVNVSDTIEKKMQAIDAHASQFGSRGISTELYRDVARLNGRMVGVDYAEGLDVGRMLLA